jgi:uncharacterized Zn-binding protein involved in type VI secretion
MSKASIAQAARVTDPVGHGYGLLGMIAGAAAGAVIGALLVTATVTTGGGALAVFIAVGTAADSIATVGQAAGHIVKGFQTALGAKNPTTGNIAKGSSNVRMGSLSAARAEDPTRYCDGLYGFNHFIMPGAPIAEGSAKVRINRRPAARVGDKVVCGAEITRGHPTVRIGGGKASVLAIDDAEEAMDDTLENVEWVGIFAGGAKVKGVSHLIGYMVLVFLEQGVLPKVGDQLSHEDRSLTGELMKDEVGLLKLLNEMRKLIR